MYVFEARQKPNTWDLPYIVVVTIFTKYIILIIYFKVNAIMDTNCNYFEYYNHLLIAEPKIITIPKHRYEANARERYRTYRYLLPWNKQINPQQNNLNNLYFHFLVSSLIYTYLFYSVNSAFVTLRDLIPTEPHDRKLSKIETLRLAKSYIEHLGAILVTGLKNKLAYFVNKKKISIMILLII